jgi:hypothetical protein
MNALTGANGGRATVGRVCLGLMVMALAFPSVSCGKEPGDDRRASASQGILCMPRPSACGFPDATNTGVTPGTPLAPVNGAVTLSTPGQVYENKLVDGSIRVTAPNVTIRNVRLLTNDDYGIQAFGWNTGVQNLRVENVEIDMQGNDDGKAIAFDNYTAVRVWFHNGLDCAHAGNNVVIVDSFCDLPRLAPGSSAHADGFQSDGGRNLTFRHNTIRNPNAQTSAILMSTNTDAIDRVVIDHNLMSGGGYTVYCGTDEGGVATNTTYTNNLISREFFPNGGRWGPATSCDRVATRSGNGWDDGTYRPPTAGAPGAGGGPVDRPRKLRKVDRLSRAGAKRLVRRALVRKFGRRFTRRSTRLRLSCRRRSASTVACRVGWAGPRVRNGRPYRRYSGKVVVRRVAPDRRRFTMRIRSWKRGCRCSRVIKGAGRLKSGRRT